MKTTIKIHIIIGSTRRGRFSEKPAQYLFDELKNEEGVEAELIDLRDWPMPFYDEAGSPAMLGGKYSNEIANKWSAKVSEADAFIIVAPEYNHGYTAVLKNALDWLYTPWNGKPVGFVSFGNAMGARAIEQLRQVVIELRMHPIQNSIHIPIDVYMAARMIEGQPDPQVFKPLREGRRGDTVQNFFNDLIGLTRTLKAGKEKITGKMLYRIFPV